MDLIELKSVWNILQEDIISNDKVEVDRIETTIHRKSKSEISKIKRGLHLKFIIASLSIVTAMIVALFTIMTSNFNPLDFVFSRLESMIFFMVMAVSLAVMVYFNYKAYSQIRNIQESSLNLKKNLASFINAMRKAIAFNIFSDTFMTPIVFAWIYYAYAFENHQLGLDLRTVSLFIFPIIVSILSYFFQRFMQHLKFGKYLSRLSTYLESLEKN